MAEMVPAKTQPHGMYVPGSKPVDANIHFVDPEWVTNPQGSGALTLTCQSFHAGWDQNGATTQRGTSIFIKIAGLPFTFTSDNCSGGDVSAWEGTPLSCSGSCSAYIQAGWEVDPGTSTVAHFMCESRAGGGIDHKIDTTNHANNERVNFWTTYTTPSGKPTGWYAFASNALLTCSGLGGVTSSSYSGLFETEENYATASTSTDGPFNYQSFTYGCGSLDWCSVAQIIAKYQPSQTEACAGNTKAGTPTNTVGGDVTIGSGQTCTVAGTTFNIP